MKTVARSICTYEKLTGGEKLLEHGDEGPWQWLASEGFTFELGRATNGTEFRAASIVSILLYSVLKSKCDGATHPGLYIHELKTKRESLTDFLEM